MMGVSLMFEKNLIRLGNVSRPLLLTTRDERRSHAFLLLLMLMFWPQEVRD